MSLSTWETFWDRQHGEGSSPIGRWLFKLREQRVGVAYAKVAMRYVPQQGRVLEAGCGSAIGSVWLHKMRQDAIVALDLYERALRVCQDTAQRHAARVELVQGSLFALPFPDKSFTLCWNSGTLEHFYHDDLVAIIREMRRVSRVAIGIVPAQHPMWSWPLAIARRLGPKVESLVNEGGYFRLYREREFREIFAEAAFDRTESLTFHSAGFPFTVAIGIDAVPATSAASPPASAVTAR